MARIFKISSLLQKQSTSTKLMFSVGAMTAAFFVPSKDASAQPVKGLYVDGAAGASFNQGQEIISHAHGKGEKDSKELFGTGYTGKGAIGWGLGNGFRVELEGNYRQNRLDRLLHTPNAQAGGHERQYGVMANALFDMDIGQNWIYPYFGAGIGYGWQQMNEGHITQDGKTTNIGGTSGGFAYQAMFGLSIPVPWVVGLSTTLEYRFYTTTGHHYHSVNGAGFTPGPAGDSNDYSPIDGKFGTRTNFNHSLMWGLRYEFNAPPPPDYVSPTSLASVAPAPAEVKSFLLYFDNNSAVITPKGQDIIELAARDAGHIQATKIDLRSANNAPVNPKLATQRANAVSAILIKDGIASSQIIVDGVHNGTAGSSMTGAHHIEITTN